MHAEEALTQHRTIETLGFLLVQEVQKYHHSFQCFFQCLHLLAAPKHPDYKYLQFP